MQYAYRNSRTRQTVSLLLIFQLVFSPLYSSLALADTLTVDPSAASNHQPTIDAAGNGVPIVQITAPSASGVSMNKYGQFNISNNGLILNNSQQITNTQLSGYIEGNSNLATSNGARIIVNQVNGSLPSALNGYAEVAGQQADVIIANPGGITCNGCGFINTNRGVLTTGTVELDNAGAVDNIRVNQGALQVNGRGLNASNINQLDLLARAIEVNADIHGQQINVVTGTNRVDYSDLSTSKIEGEEDAPLVSLDVSALGGMYANRIFMVGTEKGVGVNSEGVIAAGAGGLILTAEGDIKLKSTHSESASSLTSTAGNIELVGDHFSQQTLSLVAGDAININGAVAAQDRVAVSGHQVTIEGNGTLSVGYDETGLQRGNGELDIKADAMLNNGSVVSQGISVTAPQFDNTGTIAQVGHGDLNITGDTQVRNSGTLSATKQLSINTTDFDNSDGTVVSRDDLRVKTVDMSNRNGRLISESMLEVVSDQLVNDGGQLISQKELSLTASTLTNDSGGLQAGTELSFVGNTLDNSQGAIVGFNEVNVDAKTVINASGQLQTGGTLNLTADRLDNQDGSVLVLSDEDQTITLNTLDNRNGELATNAKNLVLNVSRLDNSVGGKIAHYGDQNTTFRGSELNNQNGIISSNGLLEITQDTLLNNNDGQVSAVESVLLSVTAGDVQNRSGLIVSGGMLDITASIINNTSGKISSQQKQKLNARRINNQLGEIESAKVLQVNAASLDNRKGSLLSLSSSDLNVSASEVNNQGGSLVSGGSINLLFSMGQRLLDNTSSGLIQAVSDLSITNLAVLKNKTGQMLANHQLSIAVDDFNYQGQIDAGYIDVLSRSDINIAAGQLWNTAGELTLHATGLLALDGEINTGRHYELIARDMTVGNAGVLAGASQGNIAISNDFSNYNRVSSNQALTVTANKLDNYGDIGGLTTQLNVGSLYNTGLLFGQNNLNIYSNSLYNDRGDIFTFGDMNLAKDSTLNKSHQITNNHGLIRSEGNLRFNTASFYNVGSYETGPSNSVTEAPIYSHGKNAFNVTIGHIAEGVRNTKTTITRETPTAKNQQTAKVVAGGSLNAHADTFVNDVSYIGAKGNIQLSGSTFNNQEGTGAEYIKTVTEAAWWIKKRPKKWKSHKNYRRTSAAVIVNTMSTVSIAASIIESLGNVALNFSNVINNGTVTKNTRSVAVTTASAHQNSVKASGAVTLTAPSASKLGGTISAPSASTLSSTLPPLYTSVNLAGLSLMVIDPLLIPGFELPSNGLFTMNKNPSHPYLIETNPLLTNYNNFTSSDYLLDRLGWSGDEYLRRIGDGFYEQTLIEDSLQAQTGSRYLDGLAGAEMFEQLMDNAVQTTEDLDLSVGVALSKDQVNRLTRSMIWMETRIVDGVKVLVPVVYLSSNRELKAEDGALIAGKNVAILGNSDVVNTGVIEALDTLAISSATGNITNHQGTLVAGNLLQADAAQNISNLSGRIEGERLNLLAGDSILNETLIENVGSVKTLALSQQGARASLSAGQTLELTAGKNITDKAGLITAGDALTLNAGEEVRVESQEQITGYQFGGGSHYQTLDRRDHLTSELQSGGDLTVASGGNILLEGASVNAADNLVINAADNINLLAVADTQEASFSYSRKGSYGSSDKRTSSESSAVNHQSTALISGADLTLSSGQNLLAYGSTVQAGGNVTIDAAENIKLIAAVDQENYAYQEKKENAVKYSNESHGYQQQNAISSSVNSGGDLSLNTAGNIHLLGSELQAEGDMIIGGNILTKASQATVTTTGSGAENVIVDTIELTNEQWHEKSKGFKGPVKELIKAASIGFAMMMGGVIDAPAMEVASSQELRTQQTIQNGSYIAAENLSIESEGLTRLAGAEVNVTENLIINSGDIQIDAVADSSERYQSSTSESIKSLGMALNKDEVSLGGIEIAKEKESQSVTTTTWKGSQLSAGNISLNADKNIDITAAQITTEQDLELNAADSLTVTGKQDQQAITDKYSKETQTITAAVRNAYVDVGFAVDAVAEAEKGVSKARKSLSEAKQKVKDGKLREKDIKYYEMNLAAATANLGQAVIALGLSGATAAGSTATAGFYASGSAVREKTETVTQTQTGEWNGSQMIAGGNAALSSGQQLALTGSDLWVGGNADLSSQNILINAGESTASSKSETHSDNQSISVSYGAKGLSGNIQAGFKNSDADSESLHYRNSQIVATNLSSQSDTLTVSGAALQADQINIATDTLVVESLQNYDRSNSQTRGANAGAGFGSSGLTSINAGLEKSDSESERRWVDDQTQIIGSESVVINAKDTTLTGAIIANATYDEQGQWVDQGNLTLNTDTLTANHLYDTDTAKSEGFNLSVSVNIDGQASNTDKPASDSAGPQTGQTTIGGHYNGHEKAQTTYATVGNGKVTVGGESQTDITGLNRDISNAQEITQDIEIGGLNASVTVDHRVFSEEGRGDIASNFEQTLDLALDAGQAVVDAADFVHDEIQVLGTNLPEELSRLGETGEKVIDELIRADLSQDEIDEIIAREKLQYAIEGIERGNQKLAVNPELAQRHLGEASSIKPPVNTISELSEPGELVITVNARDPSGLEVGVAGLGKVKQEIDDLTNTNPSAATALEYAIGFATGGPLKQGVSYAFNYGIEHVVGDHIQQVDEAINHAAGGYISKSDSETFSKLIAFENEYPDDNPVLGTSSIDISDGVRFAAGTILGIGVGSRKGGSTSQGSGQGGYSTDGNNGPSRHGAASDQDMVDSLVRERAAKNASGQATFAVGRDGGGNLTPVRESIPGKTAAGDIHAELQVLKDLDGKPKPHTVAVDQVPCSNCSPELINNNVDKVIIPSKPGNPTGSPKTAARHAAEKGASVIPKEIGVSK